MKKFLLTLASAILATSGAMAEEAVFNFLGTTDKYGLTFQTAATVQPDIETPKTITQDFVDITMNPTETGGYALGGRANTAGLWICGQTTKPSFTVSVDGGTITEISITTSSSEKRIYTGGTLVPFTSEEYPNYISTWNGANKSVTFDFDDAEGKYDGYRITNITVTYSFASGDQKEAGLSFSAPTATGVVGEAFVMPDLINPNDLPVTWSSSNEAVATVDENGNVDLVGGGKAVITAYTAGNKDFASGFASYELTVIPVAVNVAQMKTYAPVAGDKVVVDFSMFVTYVDGEDIWTVDDDNNAAYIKGENSYKVGSVLEPDWTAVNSTINGDVQWTGELPAAGPTPIEMTYPEVNTITSADHARVVWLKGVTLNETFGTSSDEGSKSVTLHIHGEAIILFNAFGIKAQEAGSYDVLGVVDYKNTGSAAYLYFYPIEFVAGSAVVPMIEKDETLDLRKLSTSATFTEVTPLPYEIKGQEVSMTLQTAENGYWISKKGLQLRGGCTDTFTVSAKDRQITKIVIAGNDYFDNVTCGGTDITNSESSDADYNTVYTWERPSTYTANDVEVSATIEETKWGTHNTILYTITVYYMAESSGLDIANLSVKGSSVTVSIAEKSFDAASNINNPKFVDLAWTSSDPEVAAVTENGIEIKSVGSTTLTASVASEGYEEETVEYTLNVVNAAMSIEQMNTLAPVAGDKVTVYSGLPFYVAASVTGTYKTIKTEEDEDGNMVDKEVTLYEAYIFAEDTAGAPIAFYKDNGTVTIRYNKDDIIEGGWTATNASTSSIDIWAGVPTAKSRAQDWFGAFSQTSSLEGLTPNKVVVLTDVTLANGVPTAKGEFSGTLADGSEVTFVNLVTRTASVVRGVYNITGAVSKNDNGKVVFYPVDYKLTQELEPLFPESVNLTTDSQNVKVMQYFDDSADQIVVMLSGSTTNKTLKVTFEVPTGWDGYIGNVMDDLGQGFAPRRVNAIADEDWAPLSEYLSDGLEKTNTLTFNVDETGKPSMGGMYLYKGEKVYVADNIGVLCQVKYDDVTGVAAIEAADASAKYFNLQGAEVKNPAPGIYVKIADGKAVKVVIR